MSLFFGGLGPSGMWFAVLFFVLLNFLCSLLGFWAGLGSSRWRWLLIAIATPTLGFLPTLNTGGDVAEFMVYCVGIVSIVAITTLLLRLTQGRLQLLRADAVAVDALRFGIRHLILWTAVAALILSVGRYLNARVDLLQLVASRSGVMLQIIGLSTMVAIATVINIWALLGMKITPTKVLILGAVTVGASLFINVIIDVGFFLQATFFSQCLLLLAIWMLRQQGYRFVKTGHA